MGVHNIRHTIKKLVINILFLSILLSTITACTKSTKTPNNYLDVKLDYNLQVEMGLEYKIINGGIYAKGVDEFGQLGEIHKTYDNWVEVVKINNAIHIDAMDATIVYLTSDGKVYGFGNSESGVLQTLPNEKGQWEYVDTPRLLFEDCKYVSTGVRFMLFLKNDNTLWFVGESLNGQSTEIKDIISKPTKIADNVLFAKAFGYTSAWIDSNNNLYLCGDNSYGQIGKGVMGCGYPTMYKDIVSKPFCALKGCIYFSIERGYNGVLSVKAEIKNGEIYAWGGEYGPSPILINN